MDLLNYAKDGTEYWLDFAITPIYSDEGELEFFAAIERDVSEYKVIQKNLYQLATTDALTSVFNRRRFIDCVNETILQMQSKETMNALLVIDVDDFKFFNDSYGHVEGDKILCLLSKAYKAACRPTDYVCRYGGDEFLILLTNVTQKDALKRANQICQQVKEKTKNKVTITIGLTLITSKDTSIDTIIRRADKALYQAKKKGKGKAEFI